MQLQKITMTGAQEKVTVSDSIFGAPVNKSLLAQAIRVYLSNSRQGTSKVKTRAEVNITKKKIYKQKGTGGARHGAKSAPIFVGGGVTHGPKGNQNWSLKLPKVLKSKALIAALSLQKDSSVVVEALEKATKTKAVAEVLEKAGHTRATLIVLDKQNGTVERTVRNITGVSVTTARDLTALAVAQAQRIIFVPAALTVLEERLNSAASTVTTPAAEKKTEKVAPVKKETKPKAAVKPTAKKVAKPAKKVEKK